MEIITNVLISVFGFHFISLLLCISVVADFCYFDVFIDYTTVKKNYPFFYPCDSEILCQWITTFLFIFYALLVFFCHLGVAYSQWPPGLCTQKIGKLRTHFIPEFQFISHQYSFSVLLMVSGPHSHQNCNYKAVHFNLSMNQFTYKGHG